MPTETVDELIEQLKELKLQENSVLEKLSQARRQEKEAQERTPTRSTEYGAGDRVYIENAIKKPLRRNANKNDRKATVLHTKKSNNTLKVFIQTDDGDKTWRLEKNLRKYYEYK